AMATPPSTVAGRTAASAAPTRSPVASSGNPSTVVASTIPTTSGGNHEPAMMTRSHARRRRGESTLPRYSNATPRPINASNSTNSGRYAPESRPAYQPGNAANMTPTATISHTSLPSQTGPIVFTSTRRSVLSRPSTGNNIPTPKSNPSRNRYPVQNRATTQNHTVSSVIPIRLSVFFAVSRRVPHRASPATCQPTHLAQYASDNSSESDPSSGGSAGTAPSTPARIDFRSRYTSMTASTA